MFIALAGVINSSQSAKMHSTEYRGKKSEGYKPSLVPTAFKVLHSNQSREEANITEQMNNVITGSQNKLIECVDHVQLPVNDIEKGTEWYSKMLGLEVMAPGWLKFGQGPLLMLHHSSKDTKVSWLSEDDFPMPAFMFLTKNIKELHAALTENNTLIRMYQDEGFGWVIKFVDPFGNELGAYEPKE